MGKSIAVIGSQGQLGRWLERLIDADPQRRLVFAWDLPEIDLGDPTAIDALFQSGDVPDILVNAAAFTAVDRCETELDVATRVNVDAPGELAARCAAAGVKMVHVGTDFVFDGEGTIPYTEDDPTGPRSAYGRTKLAGEQRVRAAAPDALVVRTAWVFGPGNNFVRTMVGQAAKRKRGEVSGALRVVDDQRGSPTYAADLAEGMLALLDRDASGLYHLAGSGEASWWELARAALDAAGFVDIEIGRISAADYPRPAATPHYSVLDCAKAAALGVRMRPWREAVSDYIGSPDSPIAEGA